MGLARSWRSLGPARALFRRAAPVSGHARRWRQTPVFRTAARPGAGRLAAAAIFRRKPLSPCGTVRQRRAGGLPHMLVDCMRVSSADERQSVGPAARRAARGRGRRAAAPPRQGLGRPRRPARASGLPGLPRGRRRAGGLEARSARPAIGPPSDAANGSGNAIGRPGTTIRMPSTASLPRRSRPEPRPVISEPCRPASTARSRHPTPIAR